MMPVLSTRNSTLPALISLTAFAMSAVTVPVFGFGMRPRGPRTLPSLPTARIMSGVATTASKSVKPPWIFSTSSSPPTMSAPASCASFCFSPPAMARTRLLLPSPCGRTTVPRTIWSACLGSTPSLSDRSMVSSNFANLTFCTSGMASSIEYTRSATCARAAVNFFPCLRIELPQWCNRPPHGRPPTRSLSDDVEPHGSRGAGDGPDGGVERLRIQIRHLRLRALFHLLRRDRAHLVLVRLGRSLGDVGRALQQNRRRRRLRDEAVRPVLIHRHDDRD